MSEQIKMLKRENASQEERLEMDKIDEIHKEMADALEPIINGRQIGHVMSSYTRLTANLLLELSKEDPDDMYANLIADFLFGVAVSLKQDRNFDIKKIRFKS